MLAFMNLQTPSASPLLEGAPDRGDSGLDAHGDAGFSSMPFANLLRARTEIPPVQTELAGEFLPPGGNSLPSLPPPSTPTGELLTAKMPGAEPGASSVEQDLLQSADSVAPDLRAGPAADALTNGRPQIDVELDLTVAYPDSEQLGDEISGVSLLPVTPESVRQARPTHADIAIPATRIGGAPMPAVAQQAIEAPLTAATTSETAQMLASASGEVIAATVTDGPLRDKVLVSPAPVSRPVAAALDNSLSADDVLDEELPPILGRTATALETVQKPDTRVAAVSNSHSTVVANLASNANSFNIEAGSGRAETMLDTMSTPVRDSAWGEKLGERVLVMTARQLQTAEIRLTPADLGPVRVRVSVEEGAAHVTFHAQHAVTREAIEQALPRLREMLTENGLSLGQADVSDHGVADGRDDRGFNSDADTLAADEVAEAPRETEMTERRKIVASNNLLDTFA